MTETAAFRKSLLLNVTEAVVCQLDRVSSEGEGDRSACEAEAVLKQQYIFGHFLFLESSRKSYKKK